MRKIKPCLTALFRFNQTETASFGEEGPNDDDDDDDDDGEDKNDSPNKRIEMVHISPPSTNGTVVSVNLRPNASIANRPNSMSVLSVEKSETVLITKTGTSLLFAN